MWDAFNDPLDSLAPWYTPIVTPIEDSPPPLKRRRTIYEDDVTTTPPAVTELIDYLPPKTSLSTFASLLGLTVEEATDRNDSHDEPGSSGSPLSD